MKPVPPRPKPDSKPSFPAEESRAELVFRRILICAVFTVLGLVIIYQIYLAVAA